MPETGAAGASTAEAIESAGADTPADGSAGAATTADTVAGTATDAAADATDAASGRPASGRPGAVPVTRVRRNRLIAGAFLALVVVAVVVIGVVIGNLIVGSGTKAGGTNAGGGAASLPTERPTTAPRPGEFNRAAYSLDDPASLWVVVNKQRPLVPIDFTPPDLVEVKVAHTWKPLLRAEAASAVETMFAAAAAEAGLSLESNSAYRSYASQVEVYTGDVNTTGAAAADQSTARPGMSEHQTGLTIDIGSVSGTCRLNVCFADTPEGRWLVDNAWRFGFLLRYPADKVAVTGYEFEPWHFRYIGTDLAEELHTTGVSTLEEFFGLPAAPTY